MNPVGAARVKNTKNAVLAKIKAKTPPSNFSQQDSNTKLSPTNNYYLDLSINFAVYWAIALCGLPQKGIVR
jgi:hypothetical protein